MDPALTSASTLSVIGIGTVFVALITLVGVVSATARLVERGRARDAGAASQAAGGSQAAADGAPLAPDLRPLALAVYALHLRRRAGVAAAGGPGASRWAMAGRLRQTTPLFR